MVLIFSSTEPSSRYQRTNKIDIGHVLYWRLLLGKKLSSFNVHFLSHMSRHIVSLLGEMVLEYYWPFYSQDKAKWSRINAISLAWAGAAVCTGIGDDKGDKLPQSLNRLWNAASMLSLGIQNDEGFYLYCWLAKISHSSPSCIST